MGKNFVLGIFLIISFIILIFSFFKSDYFFNKVKANLEKSIQSQIHGICRIGKVQGDIRNHLILNDVYIYFDLVSMTKKEPVFVAEKIELNYSLFEIMGEEKTSLTMAIEKSVTRILFDDNGWNLVNMFKQKNTSLSNLSSRFDFKDSKVIFIENRNSQKKEIYFKNVAGRVENNGKDLEIHLKGVDEFNADTSITYDQVSRDEAHRFDLSVLKGDLKQYGNYIFGVSNDRVNFRGGKFDFAMNIDSSFFDREISGKIKLEDSVLYMSKLGEAKVNADIEIGQENNTITRGTVEYGRNRIDILDGEFDSEELILNFRGNNLMIEDFPFIKIKSFKTVESIKGNLKYRNNMLNIASSLNIKSYTFELPDFPGDILVNNIQCDVELINDFLDLKSIEFYFRYSIFPLVFKFHMSGKIPESNLSSSQVRGWFELLKTPLRFKFYNLNNKFSIKSDNVDMNQNSLHVEYGGEYVRHNANLKVKLTFRELLQSMKFSRADQSYNGFNLSKIIASNIGLGGELEIRYMNDFHSRGLDFGKPEFSIYSKEIALLNFGLTIDEILVRVRKNQNRIVFLPGKFIFHDQRIKYEGSVERVNGVDCYHFTFQSDNMDKTILKEYLPEYAEYLDNSADFSVVLNYTGTLENGKAELTILMDKPIIKGFIQTDQIVIYLDQKDYFDFRLESFRINGSKDADFSLKLDVDESNFLQAKEGTGAVMFKKKGKLKGETGFLSQIDQFQGNFKFQDGQFSFTKTNLGLNIDRLGVLTVETAGFIKLVSKDSYSFEISGSGNKQVSEMPAGLAIEGDNKIGFSFKASGNENNLTAKGKVKLHNESDSLIGSSDFELKKNKLVFSNMVFNHVNIPALFSLEFEKFLKFDVKLNEFDLSNIQKVYTDIFPLKLMGKVSGNVDYNFSRSSMNLYGKNITVGLNTYENISLDLDILLDGVFIRTFNARGKDCSIFGRSVKEDIELKVSNLSVSEGFKIKTGTLRIGKKSRTDNGFPVEGENLLIVSEDREFKADKLIGKFIRKDDTILLKNTVIISAGNRFTVNGMITSTMVDLKVAIEQLSYPAAQIIGSDRLRGKVMFSGSFDIRGKFSDIRYSSSIKWKTEGFRIGSGKLISLGGLITSSDNTVMLENSTFDLFGTKGSVDGKFVLSDDIKLESAVLNINMPSVVFNPDIQELFESFGMSFPVSKAVGQVKLGIIWKKGEENYLNGSIRISELVIKGIIESRTSLKIPPGWNLNVKIGFSDHVTIETSRMNVFLNGDLVIRGKNGQGWLAGSMKILKKSKFYYINNEFDIVSGYYNFFNHESSIPDQDGRYRDVKKTGEQKEPNLTKISRNVEFKDYVFKDDQKKVLDFEDNFLYIKAYTKIGRYIIYIEVSKREEKVETRLYSTPSLTQREIIAVLLTGNDVLVSSGRVSSDDVYNDDKIINIIGSDIQNQFLYKMSGKLRKKLNFDEFRVYSDLSDDSSLPSTALSIGKFVSPKTMLHYKKSFYNKDKDFLGLDYDLNKNLKLNSEIGTQGDEVKFGIQFDKTFK